jgi:methionyl-tRNA synthetase
MTFKRHLITCALPYANGPLHIGHVAGCFLPSDIHYRYLTMKGKEVLFVCGTDEHGVPITLKAKKEGKSPQQVVDENYAVILDSLEKFGIHFSNFSRTTRPIHHETASSFFTTLYDKGIFLEEVTEQFYDEKAQQFLADRYIVGTCPNCNYDNAYGDQCENCGRSLNPQELVDPKSALTGNKPVLKETKNWFLPLDKLQKEFLNEWVQSKKEHWKSSVWGQCNSWLTEGLKPRAMTRDLNWGVPVPVDGAEGKVMYVWFDAPIGYITSTREADPEHWEKWWKDEETELIHFLGKDNIVFHTIIFPAMLYAHGDYILPNSVPANEFLNLEGQKLSTSRNHAIWLHEYLSTYPDKADELRYVLNTILPESKDSDFTWSDFQAKVNNELVAILGNFVNRVMVLNHKYYDGYLPESAANENVLQEAKGILETVDHALNDFQQRLALERYMDLARLGNKYLQDTAPWLLAKEEGNEAKIAECMFTCSQLVKHLGEYAQVFLPNTSEKIKSMLQLRTFKQDLLAGHPLEKATLLFEKIEDEAMEEEAKKLSKKEALNSGIEPIKPMIQYDDFAKLDLRVGVIKDAKKVEKADKLLELVVDIGLETRTVVSGIAEHYSPADIIGQKVTLLANLAPRKLRGVESQGMILMASTSDGKLEFVQPDTDAAPGDVVS